MYELIFQLGYTLIYELIYINIGFYIRWEEELVI